MNSAYICPPSYSQGSDNPQIGQTGEQWTGALPLHTTNK
jgi:hypothetical protein